jgi:hypothetical protein
MDVPVFPTRPNGLRHSQKQTPLLVAQGERDVSDKDGGHQGWECGAMKTRDDVFNVAEPE